MGQHSAPRATATARYVGRVGTLAVAVGIGGAVASTLGTPTAQADSAVDKLTPNVSVSAGGVGFSSGTARAKTTAGPNLAVAVGKNAKAEASNGVGNTAIVVGDRSTGTATNGNHNTVVVHGNDNTAFAGNGNGNTVRVKGNGNTVLASGGDNNKTTVKGDTNIAASGCTKAVGNQAFSCGAGRHSDNNTVAITGDRNTSLAGGLKSDEIIVVDFDGSNNSATVTGDDNTGSALGNNDTLTVDGNGNKVFTLVEGDDWAGWDNTNVNVTGDNTSVIVNKDGFTYPTPEDPA